MNTKDTKETKETKEIKIKVCDENGNQFLGHTVEVFVPRGSSLSMNGSKIFDSIPDNHEENPKLINLVVGNKIKCVYCCVEEMERVNKGLLTACQTILNRYFDHNEQVDDLALNCSEETFLNLKLNMLMSIREFVKLKYDMDINTYGAGRFHVSNIEKHMQDLMDGEDVPLHFKVLLLEMFGGLEDLIENDFDKRIDILGGSMS